MDMLGVTELTRGTRTGGATGWGLERSSNQDPPARQTASTNATTLR